MPKEKISVRLDEGLLAWMDEYRVQRRWDRTTVVEAALEALRGDAVGGVPDPPARVERKAVGRVVAKSVSRPPVWTEPPAAPVRSVPERWVGCSDHPDAGAVLNRGQHWCAEPGCPRTARRA